MAESVLEPKYPMIGSLPGCCARAASGHAAAAPPSSVMNSRRFIYVLNELTGTVTTLALDPSTGLLSELDSVSVLPPDAKLVPGMPRGAVATPGANQVPRNTDNDSRQHGICGSLSLSQRRPQGARES
jgi:hypothetical protein